MPDKGWMNSDFVRQHAYTAAACIADSLSKDLWGDLIGLQAQCESPIEAIFLMNWVAHERAMLAYHGVIPRRANWALHPQFEVVADGRKCRLDFAVFHRDKERAERLAAAGYPIPKICVELDGHEFHERTREQVAERNDRDRALQVSGWRVFHFSGAEVNADPMRCVMLVLDHAIDVWGEGGCFEMPCVCSEEAKGCPTPIFCSIKCVVDAEKVLRHA
jgi:hypothetical protein